MTDFIPRGLATGVGSLPHSDPRDALRVTLENFSALPYWPQLPKRDFRENMYAQFSENLVGVQMDLAHERLDLVKDETLMAQVEAFYARYLEDDLDLFAVSADYAAGLYALRDQRAALKKAKWIKGQVTGPISFGLKVVDQNLKPMLYDDTLRDVLVKHIARKAQWQEKFLSDLGTPIIFVDEPSLALIGASVVALNRDDVVRDLEEVFSSLHCLTGTHCCGNTDWAMLLQTSVNIISFDAYNYAENLALFAADVKHFLARGGALAWGIVPTVEEQIMSETADALVARLDAAINLLVKKGIDRALLYERALITPACGLGPVSPAAAERAFALTRLVSEQVRKRLV
ncbi:MAG: methionine synthase [Chloroflexi bacterium]|nr:methionine synthase [Chloroflexota bacterium]